MLLGRFVPWQSMVNHSLVIFGYLLNLCLYGQALCLLLSFFLPAPIGQTRDQITKKEMMTKREPFVFPWPHDILIGHGIVLSSPDTASIDSTDE